MATQTGAAGIEIVTDRDLFLRTLIRELSGVLQEVVGLEMASGYISIVGQNMGREFDQQYRGALGVRVLSPEQVSMALIDLKRRIQGDFHVIHQDEEKIVLGNRACPFGNKVIDRPAMCMMTSNVFGAMVAENLGYANVVLNETIAAGHGGCRVTIYLNPDSVDPLTNGREYFKAGGQSESGPSDRVD